MNFEESQSKYGTVEWLKHDHVLKYVVKNEGEIDRAQKVMHEAIPGLMQSYEDLLRNRLMSDEVRELGSFGVDAVMIGVDELIRKGEVTTDDFCDFVHSLM